MTSPQPFGPSDIGSMIRRDQSVAGAFQLGLEASHLELGQLEENARLQGGQNVQTAKPMVLA